MCLGLHIKYLLFVSYFNELEFSRQMFEKKHSNIKFNENPSSANQVVSRGQAAGDRTERQTDRQTDRYEGANGHFPQFCEHA
jgi:hypothetical protein